MFRAHHALSWSFHKNSSRWPHNVLAPGERPPEAAAAKEYPRAPLSVLPPPALPAVTLERAIAGRFSCRRFSSEPLALAHLATLLALAYGVEGRYALGDLEVLERPVPSGGGLYPLEVYVLARRVAELAPGIYHYAPLHHGLELLREIELPAAQLGHMFMAQPYVADAGAVVVLTAVIERTMWKYRDRGYRYILMECGHVAQNLNLGAVALGLGSLNLGGFFDDQLTALLELDDEREVPLYAVAAGTPSAGDRQALRAPPGEVG